MRAIGCKKPIVPAFLLLAGGPFQHGFNMVFGIAASSELDAALDAASRCLQRFAQETLGRRLRQRQQKRITGMDAGKRNTANHFSPAVEVNARNGQAPLQHLSSDASWLQDFERARVDRQCFGQQIGLLADFHETREVPLSREEICCPETNRPGSDNQRWKSSRHGNLVFSFRL